MGVDVLIVGLGSTAGLRRAEDELLASLRRAGASTELVRAAPQRDVRTFALTDLVWARAARRAAREGLATHAPRAVVYSTIGAALLWPQPGAIRFDAVAADNRPGRHGLWQRPVERRRVREATLLIPQVGAALDAVPRPHADAVVIPIPVEPSGPTDGVRDVAALTYAADAHKKGLDRVLRAWSIAHRPGEDLLVAGGWGTETGLDLTSRHHPPGVRAVGRLAPDEYRALLRRARVYVTAPRREDYGIAQLEALADGAQLVTTTAPGPYAALPIARQLDPRLVVDDPGDAPAFAAAIRAALDDPRRDYAPAAAEATTPFGRVAVDRIVASRLLPTLLR